MRGRHEHQHGAADRERLQLVGAEQAARQVAARRARVARVDPAVDHAVGRPSRRCARPTMAAVTQPTVHQPGQPPAARTMAM